MARTQPGFIANAVLGELVAAQLERDSTPPAPRGEHGPDIPPETPTDRAWRTMLARAAHELRTYHGDTT